MKTRKNIISNSNGIVNIQNKKSDFDDANDYSSATGVATAENAEEKPAKSTRRTRKADTRKATEDRLFNKRELERLSRIKSELEDADELTVEQVTSLWGEMRKLQRNVTAMSMAHQITNEELTHIFIELNGFQKKIQIRTVILMQSYRSFLCLKRIYARICYEDDFFEFQKCFCSSSGCINC